jgi:hypothetical protein
MSAKPIETIEVRDRPAWRKRLSEALSLLASGEKLGLK